MGTHGTSQTRAVKIVAEKRFLHTSDEDGRCGGGVYFWAYEKSVIAAKHLAKLWWTSRTKFDEYKADPDPGCAVVNVEIRPPSEFEFVDTSTLGFREAVYEMLGKPNFEEFGEFKLNRAIALLIKRLEEKTGSKVLVAKLVIDPPKKTGEKSVLSALYSMHPAYLVREGGDHLIEKIEILD